MKTISWKTVRHRVLAFAIALVVSNSALAQARKATNTSLQLGDTVVVIPAPDGFEEAASQFESIKAAFTATEDPGNDMLAVHLLITDCEKLRHGESGTLTFYTKISVLKTFRERDLSASEFATIPAEFQKSGAALLDINGPRMKAATEHAEKAISEISENKMKVEMTQPVNLGEFDNRPNIYSVMLLMNLTVQSGDDRRVVPLLGALTFVRVKQRLLYVNTYRRYESKTDAEILRDFTKHWIDTILSAN
jgi:hypothetical protein